MIPVKVKICGNTNSQDVGAAIDAGADFIGLIFAESTRKISGIQARNIISDYKNFQNFVGVFADHPIQDVERMADDLNLTWIQLHGSETPDYCSSLIKKGRQLIKTIKISDAQSILEAHRYSNCRFLFDTFKVNKIGGTGETFEWAFAKNYPDLMKNSFLAGGLTPQNVQSAIASLHPYAVDVVSSLEKSPGIKDHVVLREFIKRVRQA